MKAAPSLEVRYGSSTALDPRVAVAEIHALIRQEQMQLVLFFCSPLFDLDRLASELRTTFDSVPMAGCTSAGQIAPDGFVADGLTALSFAGDLTALPFAVDFAEMENSVAHIAGTSARLLAADPIRHAFGLLLVDGLSLMEEKLASLLYRHLPNIPIVGGSAGDNLRFQQTHVYVDGAFRTGAAVFTLFRTRLPFRTLKFAHFAPTDQLLVATRSDPGQRVIHEFNGEPAARVYAEMIGVSVAQLDAAVFAAHPLIFELGGEQYVRSIARANSDQSLTFYCAIEDGIALCPGRAVDPVATARAAFQRVRDEFGEPAVVIGCDCILRRLEFEQHGQSDEMNAIMRENHVIGFNTYGEQFDGLHINQTFTGIALGRDHAGT